MPPLPALLLALVPTPEALASAREDVWAEAAIRQPGGPSYEFFRDLLPPLRYVNTAFRHYPIVLAPPGSRDNARWVSNGGGVNLHANNPPMWKEVGSPVAFFVGGKPEPFGADVGRLDGPRYADGWLPIVSVGYTADGVTYRQEAFAPVRGRLAGQGAVFVRFTADKPGRVVARGSDFVMQPGPKWAGAAGTEIAVDLTPGTAAEVVAYSRVSALPAKGFPSWDEERKACVDAWTAWLAGGARFDVPEPVVQNAWRALVAGIDLIAIGDEMNYSSGNAYDHLYEAECGDAVRALMLFGRTADARKMIGPLLRFNRAATQFHVAGHKLQLLAHYYWVTRDADYVREQRPWWELAVRTIRNNRKTPNALVPKENYAGDVATQVYSLNSNASCWRGLRDTAAVLEDLGDRSAAADLRKEADEFRRAILDAVAKSERPDRKFIPVSLLANEEPHDPLTATRIGSYYDLIIPYVLGSGVLGPERDGWIIDYLRRHGGLAMGMIRSTPHQGQFKGQPGVNVLYGLRYNLAILRRGDRDHALAGFYGHLAQGMTRDTFVGGEGSRFFHGDRHGRSFYLPPNSAANATFLTTLRYLLIQDWDLDDDGRPETLRLCNAIPSRWLTNGAVIDVRDAPTAFGPVSLRVESQPKRGEVVVTVTAPPRPVGRWELRLPNPPGYAITAVRIGNDELKRGADGRITLAGRTGTMTVRYLVQPVQ